MRQREACDRCGYSRQSSYMDRGGKYIKSHALYPLSSHIADAAFEIIVFPGRSLYLCSHHFHVHEAAFAARGYVIRPSRAES